MMIRAVAVGSPAAEALAGYPADVVLVDGPEPGSGTAYDRRPVGDLVHRHRVLLAGGLGPDDVGAAVRLVRPWGVDVASGVESAPGRKDPHLMARFVTEARTAAHLQA